MMNDELRRGGAIQPAVFFYSIRGCLKFMFPPNAARLKALKSIAMGNAHRLKTRLIQALQGRNMGHFLISPLQGLSLRVHLFHRALPDANAKRLSALTTLCNIAEI